MQLLQSESVVITDHAEHSQPFGALAPTLLQGQVRAFTHTLPFNYVGRKLVSLLLGAAGGRSQSAFDVSVFETQKARLHPRDNICEKRVFIAPQHWDPVERQLLADVIKRSAEDKFVFLDIGANAGLYTLFARSAAQAANKSLRALCIEPDKEMQARAAFNFAASGADKDATIFPYAASAKSGVLRFSVNRENRGMSRLDEGGDIEIDARTILDIIKEAEVSRIDAMKIDIEGKEFPALSAFFENAPENFWPSFVILETSHEAGKENASQLFEDRRYRLLTKTKLNSVYKR